MSRWWLVGAILNSLLERWAPWEACAVYLRRAAGATNAMRDDPRFSLWFSELEMLRLLLTSPAMRDVWPKLQAQGVDAMNFAITASDFAAQSRRGVSDWDAQSRAERAEKSLKIAALARELARELERSPARDESVFQFFDDAYAPHIASRVLNHPHEVMASMPRSAQDAIRLALPPSPSAASWLEQVARQADEWARQPPPFGRRDEQQHARAFVRKLAEYLRDQYGCPMLKEVGTCCQVLLGVDFVMKQLRDSAKMTAQTGE